MDIENKVVPQQPKVLMMYPTTNLDGYLILVL